MRDIREFSAQVALFGDAIRNDIEAALAGSEDESVRQNLVKAKESLDILTELAAAVIRERDEANA